MNNKIKAETELTETEKSLHNTGLASWRGRSSSCWTFFLNLAFPLQQWVEFPSYCDPSSVLCFALQLSADWLNLCWSRFLCWRACFQSLCTSKLPLSMKSFDPECWRKFKELKSATNYQKIYLNFSLKWSWLIFVTTGGGELLYKVNLKFTPFLPVGSNATKLDSNQFYFSSLATPALLRVREMDLFSPLPHNPIPPHT